MPDIWGIATIFVKMMLYIGVAGSVGLVIIRTAFADLISPIDTRMRLQILCYAGVAFAASVLGYLLRGAALTGEVGGMIDPEMLGLLWQTSVGDVLVYRIAGVALIIIGVLISFVGQWIALVGGVIALWSFTQIGHIPELEVSGVRLLLLLHLIGVAFWIGVLGPLRSLSRQPEHLDRAARFGHRFGQVASIVVPALIVAGVLMAWMLLGDLKALITGAYGQALLLKLVLVGVVLTLATANKLRFVPAMQRGDNRAAQHLARSIEIESLVFLAILTATATLTSALALPS